MAVRKRRDVPARLVGVTGLALGALIAGLGTAGASNRSPGLHEPRVGHALSRSEIQRIAHPSGVRTRSGTRTNAVHTSNWSGLVDTDTGIEGAEASWTVPSVQASSTASYSSTWVGVDGVGSDTNLIQTGTEQDTTDGYYAWWEILPAASTVITDQHGNPVPVVPGDRMLGVVQEAAPGTWTITLEDLSQSWEFQQEFSYSGPGESAEWVEEAPTEASTDMVDPLADFGTVGFTQTAEYGDLGSSGTTWYGTNMDASNEYDITNAAGTEIVAEPSAPTSDPSGGQDFTDTYEVRPVGLTPPQARISSPTDGYQLSRDIRVTYSATDPSSPVATYDVRYYVYPWDASSPSGYRYPPSWQGTTSRSVDLVGHPGDEYCFEVRATSESGASSAWTSYSCANLPLGEAALRTSPGTPVWSRHAASQCNLCSYAESSRYEATLQLSGAWANQVAVVATRCQSCGVIDVWAGQRLLGSLNTHGGRMKKSLFVLPSFPNGRVTVYLVDGSRAGKVIINGLGIG